MTREVTAPHAVWRRTKTRGVSATKWSLITLQTQDARTLYGVTGAEIAYVHQAQKYAKWDIRLNILNRGDHTIRLSHLAVSVGTASNLEQAMIAAESAVLDLILTL